MIKVTSPFMQKEIIALLESSEDPSYTYIKKQGIQLHFDTTSLNKTSAVDYAKQLLKKQDFAKGIVLSVAQINQTKKAEASISPCLFCL